MIGWIQRSDRARVEIVIRIQSIAYSIENCVNVKLDVVTEKESRTNR